MLDIHALQVFCEAASSGSFTAAGRKLHMTQPAVSMQIKTLEDHLQVKLFERNGRSMQLTKAGQALIPRAREIIDLTLRTEEFIRSANDEVLGDLVVGCSLPSANEVLIQLVARFHQLYPLVRVRIPTVSKGELVEKIVSGQYDFGIMNVVDRCEPVDCLPLFHDEIVLIAPIGHPFQRQPSVQPRDLLGQRFVCQGEDSACRYAVRDALKVYGVDTDHFDVRMEIGSHSAIIAAVEQGIGLAFVSRVEAAHALARGTIRTVDVSGVSLKTSVWLVFSSIHPHALAGLKFKEFVTHTRTRAEINRIMQATYKEVQAQV